MPGLSVEIASTEFVWLFYISFLGTIVGTIACVILLLNVSYHYSQLFCKKEKSDQDRTGYILVILYIILVILLVVGFACLRSNMFTLYPVESFTKSQATISYFWIFILFGNSYVILWIIFIHRIRIIFSGSLYAYKPYVFRLMYIYIFFGQLFWFITSFLDYQQVLCWKLFAFKNTYLGYPVYVLTRDFRETGQFSRVSLFVFILYGTAINIVLLYMFTSSLWKLNKQFMKNYVEEQLEYSVKKRASRLESDTKAVTSKCTGLGSESPMSTNLEVSSKMSGGVAAAYPKLSGIELNSSMSPSGQIPTGFPKIQSHSGFGAEATTDSKFRSVAGIRIDSPKTKTNNGSAFHHDSPASFSSGDMSPQTTLYSIPESGTHPIDDILKMDDAVPQIADRSESQDAFDENTVNTNRELEVRVSMDVIFDMWKRQKTPQRMNTRHRVQRIADLHNLIKKQTILVCIALCSDLLYIGIIFFEPIEWLTGWFYCVNVICIWLMLVTSKKYWIICKLYGFCHCCYRKSNQLKF